MKSEIISYLLILAVAGRGGSKAASATSQWGFARGGFPRTAMLSHRIPEIQGARNANQHDTSTFTVHDLLSRLPHLMRMTSTFDDCHPRKPCMQPETKRIRQQQHNKNHRNKVRMLFTQLRHILGTYDDVDTLRYVIYMLEGTHL